MEGETGSLSDGVTPEFRALMDSYEAFFDEYVSFLRRYSENPEDLGLLMQYLDFLSRYEDAMDELDAINDEELTAADAAYYVEVTARIEVKLLEALPYM